MTALLLVATLAVAHAPGPAQGGAPSIVRDQYGVPLIRATSEAEAFELQGYATAQDRIWQLENSRRVARGKMSEAFGRGFAASDREVIRLGYSDEELDAQLEALSERTRAAITAYVAGVNRYLTEAKAAKALPAIFAQSGIDPAPWTVRDSAAIFVQLARRFGSGGAGELRNWAVTLYLQAQPNAKDRALDVFDDLLWNNDFRATTTVQPGDDQVRPRPSFPNPTRDVTTAHLARLPKVNLLELLPAVRLASGEESRLVAESVSAPFKVGSYAVAVAGKRSLSGWPLLLSAPQMGHSQPSVVHEVALDTPTLKASGMAVPGVPGVAIGVSPYLANALTSGVADTDDIVFYAADEGTPGGYRYGRAAHTIKETPVELAVKGEAGETVRRLRTIHGPVVFQAKSGEVFAQRMSYWMRELQGLEVLINWPRVTSPDEVDELAYRNPLSFNLFYATKTDIGYLYTGDVPVRPNNLDPRLPMPAAPETVELGMIPKAQMPRVRNPKDGLLTNWNNKPAAWWSNSDTPVWGRIFRHQRLIDALKMPKIGVADVERSAWTIARQSDSYRFLRSYLPGPRGLEGQERQAAEILAGYDGWKLAGNVGPRLYEAWLDSLRTELLAPITGSFLNEATFRLVGQPSLLLNALEGRTKVDYRRGRSSEEISRRALEGAIKRLNGNLTLGYVPGSISVYQDAPIPYSDRGTFIQVVELGPVLRQRTIASPGAAESGVHATDQVPMARAWLYKQRQLPSGFLE